jgi:hypothetical protein
MQQPLDVPRSFATDREMKPTTRSEVEERGA